MILTTITEEFIVHRMEQCTDKAMCTPIETEMCIKTGVLWREHTEITKLKDYHPDRQRKFMVGKQQIMLPDKQKSIRNSRKIKRSIKKCTRSSGLFRCFLFSDHFIFGFRSVLKIITSVPNIFVILSSIFNSSLSK